MHIGIFDTVVDHLDVVARSANADVSAAGRAIDLSGHLGHHWLDARIRVLFAAQHHARPFERARLSARHAHADKADLLLLQRGETSIRVGEERVAAVDHDVIGLKIGQQLVDHVVNWLASLHHDENHARFGQRRHECLKVLGRGKTSLVTEVPDEIVGPPAMTVVKRYAKPLTGRIPG